MSRDNFREEVWIDPEIEAAEVQDRTDWVRMMNRRGKVAEIHPAQVAAKQKQGWEVCVIQ